MPTRHLVPTAAAAPQGGLCGTMGSGAAPLQVAHRFAQLELQQHHLLRPQPQRPLTHAWPSEQQQSYQQQGRQLWPGGGGDAPQPHHRDQPPGVGWAAESARLQRPPLAATWSDGIPASVSCQSLCHMTDDDDATHAVCVHGTIDALICS